MKHPLRILTCGFHLGPLPLGRAGVQRRQLRGIETDSRHGAQSVGKMLSETVAITARLTVDSPGRAILCSK